CPSSAHPTAATECVKTFWTDSSPQFWCIRCDHTGCLPPRLADGAPGVKGPLRRLRPLTPDLPSAGGLVSPAWPQQCSVGAGSSPPLSASSADSAALARNAPDERRTPHPAPADAPPPDAAPSHYAPPLAAISRCRCGGGRCYTSSQTHASTHVPLQYHQIAPDTTHPISY